MKEANEGTDLLVDLQCRRESLKTIGEHSYVHSYVP